MENRHRAITNMREGVTMNQVANAMRIVSANGIDVESLDTTNDSTPELSALLEALSTVLRDTIGRFEEISGRVTENVMTRGYAADDHLIVALQDFDRLQQEFAALGDVISHCATASSAEGNAGHAAFGYEAIAVITLADLRDRLLNCLRSHTLQFDSSLGLGEQVF
jgi:hypothetical protein